MDNIVSYLVNKDIVSKKSIVESDLKIISHLSKNCNFQIITKKGKSFMVKQPFFSDLQHSLLSNEAEIYSLVKKKFPNLEFIFPNVIEFDKEQQILITELLPRAKTLYEYIHKQSKKDECVKLFRLLGQFIATYHKMINIATLGSQSLFNHTLTLPEDNLCRPSSQLFTDLTMGGIELIKIIQKNNLCDMFNEARNNWSVECLINLDMKLQNVLIYSNKLNASNLPKVKLVDWEYGVLGDPMWDLGCIFNDFICYWLFSLDLSRNKPSSDIISLSKRPLTEMQSYIRATWQGYIETLNIENTNIEKKLLMKAILYCSTRLINSAYELQYSLPYLSKTTVSLLQMSVNIFKDQKQASIYVLGIPNII